MNEDVFIYRCDLPLTVNGLTVPNPDATYTVYLNARHPRERQEEALRHELYHIRHDHLYQCAPVAEQEEAARRRPAAEKAPAPAPATEQKPRPTLPPYGAWLQPGYGFVRHGEHLLFWEKLPPGQESAEIREDDRTRRVVPARTVPYPSIDIWKD